MYVQTPSLLLFSPPPPSPISSKSTPPHNQINQLINPDPRLPRPIRPPRAPKLSIKPHTLQPRPSTPRKRHRNPHPLAIKNRYRAPIDSCHARGLCGAVAVAAATALGNDFLPIASMSRERGRDIDAHASEAGAGGAGEGVVGGEAEAVDVDGAGSV